MQINIKKATEWLCRKNLYEFIKEFWDAYENVPFSDCWLIEFEAECFMYSFKHFLPNYVIEDWIDDKEYNRLKNKYSAVCPVRDKMLNGEHTHNHDWNVPPRHMKSSIMNILGPVWLELNTPITIASVSHTSRLSTEMNTKRQSLLNSLKFKYYFDYDNGLKLKVNTTSKLVLNNGGTLYSVCQESFTGFGADGIIADDIISADNAAKDMKVLKNTIAFFRQTLPTRLNTKKTGVIWQIQQRLANGDISGTIAKNPGLAKVYSHTEIPAIANKEVTYIYPCSGKIKKIHVGDYLWEERFGDYSQLRMEVGESIFQTQFNQDANKSSDNPIKESYIHYINEEDFNNFKNLAEVHYASHDCPVKDKEINDFHGFCDSYGRANELVVNDAWEEHLGFVKEKQVLTSLYNLDKSLLQIVEDKANGSSLLQELRNAVPGLIPFNPGTDSKIKRAEIAAVYLQSGAVRFRDTPNNAILIQRLIDFPFVEHDDIVDAFVQNVIYHFTNSISGIYTNSFSYANVSREEITDDIDRFCLFAASLNNTLIKIIRVYINPTNGIYTVLNEWSINGLDEFEKFYKTLPYGTRILDCSYQNSMSSILSSSNIIIEKFIDRDLSRSVQGMRVGFYKKKILVHKDCQQTINDISKLRMDLNNVNNGTEKFQVVDEGFEGCLRGLVTKLKGLGATWY